MGKPCAGRLPTWLAAAAAIAALVVAVRAGRAAASAAGAAWKAVRIEQDRDTAIREAERRQQAEQVAAWPSQVPTDPTDPGSRWVWGAAIGNASQLPVYQVAVEYGTATAVVIELVPPGHWLTAGRVLFPQPDRLVVTNGAPPGGYMPIALSFTDARNARWRRDIRGILSAVGPSDDDGT